MFRKRFIALVMALTMLFTLMAPALTFATGAGSEEETTGTGTSEVTEETNEQGSDTDPDEGDGAGNDAGDTNTGADNTGDTGTGDAGADNTGDTGTGDSDTGTGDTGTGDTGTGDTGTGNAGTGDTGTGNAGTGDTGTSDTGTGDTGTDETLPPATVPSDGDLGEEEVEKTRGTTEPTTITVAIISYVNRNRGTTGWTVHYWDDASNGGDAPCSLTNPQTVVKHSLDGYWENAPKDFLVYTATIPAGVTGYEIHKDGNKINTDFNTDLSNKGVYVFEYGDVYHTQFVESIGYTLGAITVYYKTTWDQPRVHYWFTDGGSVDFGGTTWPGVYMTPVQNQENKFKATIPANVGGLLFNNGSGDQTVDIRNGIENGAYWRPNGQDGNGLLRVEPAVVTVTFNLNGGNIGGDTNNVEVTVQDGDSVAAQAPTPTKESYRFVGWLLEQNSDLFDLGLPLYGDTNNAITLYAQYKQLYTVTAGEFEHGTVTADKAQAVEGETVTLTVTPAEGFALKSMTVTGDDGVVPVENNSFIMPASDVTVTATFSPIVAKIGDTGYETLQAAVAAADTGDVVEILAAGTYTLPNLPKNITLEGKVDGVVFNHTTAGNIASIPNGATIKNVTFNLGNVDYHGFQHNGGLTFEGCVFNGKFFTYGNETYRNCTFNQTNSDYNMWVYGGNTTVVYDGCTFTNTSKGKFLNVYRENGEPVDLTINNCTFINQGSPSKAAVNVKETCGSIPLNFNVKITDSTTQGAFPESSTSNTLVVGGSLWQVDDRQSGAEPQVAVFLDGVQVYPVYVASVFDGTETKNYTSLQAALDAAHGKTGNVTVTLLADIEGYSIVHQKAGLNLTIDGDGHTLQGQIIIDGDGRASGTETLTIKNVKFEDDNSHFCPGTDAFVIVPSTKDANKPYTTGKYNYAHNITVKDCSFSGMYGNTVAFKSNSGAGAYNVTLDNLTGTNLHSLAQFTGTTGATITNCTVTNAESAVNVNGGTGDYIISDNTFNVSDTGYGVRIKNSSTANAVLSANSISAGKAFVLGSDATINVQSGRYKGVIEKNTTSENAKIIITDGYFTVPPKYDYCGTVNGVHLYAIENTNEATKTDYPYTVGTGAVAMVNEVGYFSFANAAAARTSNDDVIKLLENITDEYTLTAGEPNEILKVQHDGKTLTVKAPEGYARKDESETVEGVTVTTYTLAAIYTVTFNANGGSEVEAQQVEDGKTATQPTDPTKEHYTFQGWFSDEELTTAFVFATPITANVTLYAKWLGDPCTITFINGYTGETLHTEATRYGDPMPTYVPNPLPTREGYDLDVNNLWTPVPGETVTGSIVYSLNWIEQHTVTFDANGGTLMDENNQEVTSITKKVSHNGTVEAPTPTREGHTFLGWFDGNNEFDFTKPVHDSFTLQAHWQINQYTVTFMDGDTVLATFTEDFGTSITEPVPPAKEGQMFLGWDHEVPATIPAEDLTINAQYATIVAKIVDGETTTYFASVEAALNAAQSGQTVEVYPGTHDIPATAVIPENVTLKGAGKDQTTLTITTTNGDGLKITKPNVTISDMTIDGRNIRATGNPDYHSLVNVEADSCVIDNVVMTGGAQTTWNSSILVETLSADKTFTVKNSTISGSFRGVLRESCSANIVIENCEIDAIYPFNIDGGNGGEVTVTNSKLHGWTSYSKVDKVTFTNCEFSKGNSGYDCVAAYVDTYFEGCTFDADFEVYAQTSPFTFYFDDCEKAGTKLTFTNFTENFSDSDVWVKCDTYVNGHLVGAVAMIGEGGIGNEFKTVQAAVDAAPADGTETTITMIDNSVIEVDGTGVIIPAGKNVVLDLNGKTITGNNATESTSQMILNKGTLKITDSSGEGKIEFKPTNCWVYSEANPGGYASNLIRNEGTLVVNGGILYNEGTGSAAYAIDNYGSGKVTVNGGTIDAKKASAIRMFYCNGGEITVFGGTIGGESNYMGIQVMSGTNVSINITGGAIMGSYALYTNSTGTSSAIISGGTFSGYVGFAAAYTGSIEIGGGKFNAWAGTWGDHTEFISGGEYAVEPDAEYIVRGKCAIQREDDWWIIGEAVAEIRYTDNGIVKTIGYATLEAAFAAAKDGETIKVLKEIEVAQMINVTKTVTLDLDGHKVSGNNGGSIVMIKDGATLTIDGTEENSEIYGRINVGTSGNNNGSVVLNGGYYHCCSGQTVLHVNGECMNSNVTIKNAKVTSPNDNGIQLNGKGTHVIENSTISGKTAVYIKAGTVTVTGSTLESTAAAHTDYNFNNNGSNPTGDAVVIDVCGYPGGDPSVAFGDGNTIKVAENSGNLQIGYYEKEEKETPAVVTVKDNTLTVPKDYKWVETETAGVYKLTKKVYVAEIVGGEKYETLKEAVATAQDGDEIVMLKNEAASTSIIVNSEKNITIDLKGYTVSGGYVDLYSGFLTIKDTAEEKGAFNYLVYANVGDDTSKAAGEYNSFTLAEGAVMNSNVYVYQNNTDKGYGTKIAIDGAMNGYIFVLGNIHEGNTTIDVRGTINSNEDVAIALNGYAIVNVYEGASIEAKDENGNGTGIEVRAGELNVKGGTIKANGSFVAKANDSGTTTTGVAVAISQHTTNLPIKVTISGGTLTGEKALYEVDLQDETTENVTVSVTEGYFTGKVESENLNGFITQGHFSEEPEASYIIPNKCAVLEGEWWIIDDAVAAIGDIGYASLAKAVAASKDDDTIKMLKDDKIARYIKVNTDVTLDLNGKTVAALAGGLDVYGEFTITDNSDGAAGKLVPGTWGVWANDGAKVTVEKGTIEAHTFAIIAQGSSEVVVNGGTITADNYGIHASGNAAVTLNDGSVSGKWGIAVIDSANLTVNNGNVTSGVDGIAISTNGNAGQNATVVINEGTIMNEHDLGIYMPSGNLNVNGGTITGTTAVYVKSGKTTITGGTLHGTGEKADYSYYGNGANATGDALVVDNCGYPNGDPVVEITGGTFESDNAKGVGAYYDKTNKNELALVTSTDKTITVLENQMWIETDTAGVYKLVEAVVVTFVTEEGVAAPSAQRIEKGTKATKPMDPMKDNYIFLGWFEEGVNEAFDFENTTVTEDITLTAKFEGKPIRIIYANYFTGDIIEEFNVHFGDPKSEYTISQAAIDSIPAREGYHFDLMKWIKGLAVTFNPDNGTNPVVVKVDQDATVTKPIDPVKEGYDFAGWFNGNNEYDFDAPVTASLILTAYWTPKKMTVTFDTDGGNVIAPVEVDYDTPVAEPAAPTKNGYVFAGWTLNGEAYDFGTPVRGKITLKAVWTEAAASISDVMYTTLEAAFAAAKDGDTIVLLKDVTTEGITADKKVTLDMNAHEVKSDAPDLFMVTGDLMITGNGRIKGPENGAAFDGNALITVDGGKLTIENGTLTATGAGSDGMYGVYIMKDGTAVFGNEDGTGPAITSHFAAIGTNNTTAPATVTVNGGTYTANATPSNNEWWYYFCTPIYTAAAGNYTINGGMFNGWYGLSDRYANVDQTIAINGGSFNASSGTQIFVDDEKGSAGIENRRITSATNELTVPDGYAWLALEEGGYLLVEAVAQVEDGYYATFEEAFAVEGVVGGEKIIKLLADGAEYEFHAGDVLKVQKANDAITFVYTADEGVIVKVSEPDENGTVTYTTAEPVAKIGSTYYATVAEAIAAVNVGETIDVLKDVAENVTIAEGKSFTLDLGGHTLTGYVDQYDADVTVKNGTIAGTIYANGLATGQNGKLTIEADATVKADYAIILYQASDNTGNGFTIDINGTVEGIVWVMGNITTGNSVINVNNGATITGDDVGIALNGCATVNVNDGATVTGTGTGIEVRAGEMNVTGGKITGNGATTTVAANGSGTTTTGAGIAVAQHTTQLNVKVNISGGTINGTTALNVANPQNNETGEVEVAVTGGIFNGPVKVDEAETRVKNFISGGDFIETVEPGYVVEGKLCTTTLTETINGTPYYYIVNAVTVTFDANEGQFPAAEGEEPETIIEVVIPAGEKVVAAETPTREPYHFEGWFEENAAAAFDFENTAITADLTLKAKWHVDMYTVTVTSSGNGQPIAGATVANVTGGGSYTLGAKITVSAPTVSGYTFLGWYVLNGDKLSDQQDYEYTVLAEGNNLIAVYTPVGGATFRLTVTGSKFTVSGINATQRSYFDRKITANETITVNFTGTEKFLYWINSSNKIVSRSPEYTFMLVQDTDLTAVYSEADTAEALIVFVSAKVDGQVMSSFYATASDPIEFPLVPSSMGKTFKYWSIDGTNEATADVIHNAIASAQDGRIEVYPVYESAGSTYDVTVVCVDENGNEINRETPYSGVAVGSSRTVTAQATLNGKAFSYWTDEAGNILAYTTAYTVRPVESIMLYAVYGIEAEARPTIVMTQAYASMNGTYYRVSFTTSRSVPENYTVQSVGQLYVRAEYLDTTSEDAIKQALTIGSENGNVKNVKSSSTEANDTHTLNVNTSDMNRVFYARGYLVVDGPNGVETIYTDTYLFGSYNTLNDGN